jgi:hypothetical protein
MAVFIQSWLTHKDIMTIIVISLNAPFIQLVYTAVCEVWLTL